MDAGIPATSPEAKAVAERHRRHISTWFYPCSPEIHAGLGAMYVADARFTKNLDRGRAGLLIRAPVYVLAVQMPIPVLVAIGGLLDEFLDFRGRLSRKDESDGGAGRRE